jgi:hypothetical protein
MTSLSKLDTLRQVSFVKQNWKDLDGRNSQAMTLNKWFNTNAMRARPADAERLGGGRWLDVQDELRGRGVASLWSCRESDRQ